MSSVSCWKIFRIWAHMALSSTLMPTGSTALGLAISRPDISKTAQTPYTLSRTPTWILRHTSGARFVGPRVTCTCDLLRNASRACSNGVVSPPCTRPHSQTPIDTHARPNTPTHPTRARHSYRGPCRIPVHVHSNTS